jgi:hypothetical protein
MILNRNYLRSALLVLAFSCAAAETSPKDAALNSIIVRANAKQPQSTAVTEKQLQNWAAKYKGTLQERVVTSPPTGGKPAIEKDCPSSFRTGGGTCRLVSAWSINGRMTCHYACS